MELFIVLGAVLVVLGLAFLLNIRNLGVRCLEWNHKRSGRWSRMTLEVDPLAATPRTARAVGLIWLLSGAFAIFAGLNT